MATNSKRVAILAALFTLTGCQQAAPPTANTSTTAPTVKAPASPAIESSAPATQPVKQAQTGFIAPALPVTSSSVQQTPVSLPWKPVSAAESFNDRAYPALREWTAGSGGFHTAAKFDGLIDGQIQLHKGAGGEVLVPLNKLSNKDQQYVKELIRVDPKANVTIGKVFRVMDNQTISITDDGGYRLVHLEGIEALDAEQKRGSEAKDVLSAKVQDKYVWIEWLEKNKSDFLIGQVYLDGRNINIEMVAEGHARHDRLPRTNPRLANAELIAQHKRLGVWSDDYAESPFSFGTAK